MEKKQEVDGVDLSSGNGAFLCRSMEKKKVKATCRSCRSIKKKLRSERCTVAEVSLSHRE